MHHWTHVAQAQLACDRKSHQQSDASREDNLCVRCRARTGLVQTPTEYITASTDRKRVAFACDMKTT